MAKLSNDSIMEVLRDAHSRNETTKELAEVFIAITDRHLNKPGWNMLTYQADMRQESLFLLTKVWRSFNMIMDNPNPFSFLTIVAHSACLGVMAVVRRREATAA